MRRIVRNLALMTASLLPLGLTGCVNPLGMGFFTPIPIMPWVTERMEDKYLNKNDYRAVIMPPIREGFPPPICEDPPSEQQILRALPRVARGVPYFYEEFRDDIEIRVEKIVDKIDPPRFFPLVGPAQLHHCHYKCTVYWTETIQTDQPFPVRLKKPRIEVVYIDKDHLHQYVGPDPVVQDKITREHTDY